jgi:integrase
MERARYQFGSLTRKKRAKGSDAWEFRYYESTDKGSRLRKTATVGTVDKYKNKALAQKAVEALLLKLNSETPQQRMAVVTFGAICDRYIQEELPERHSTSRSYRSNIKNYLKPRWGDYLLDHVRPMAVEDWLKKLPMAPKSKTHIRSVMHLMYECATRWELFTDQRNTIALARVKSGSKRRQRPTILTVEQFETIVTMLKEPYRTMAYIAQCLGLRVSEIAALQWDDFDFEKNQLLVQRSIVNGNVDDVKIEYSQDYVPLHSSLTEVVLGGSKESVPTEEGWVFANPISEKPYFPTQIPEATPPVCRMVSGRVPEVRCWFGRLVSAGPPDTEWHSLTDPQGAPNRSREVQLEWVAYLPPHLLFVAGRDRSAYKRCNRN